MAKKSSGSDFLSIPLASVVVGFILAVLISLFVVQLVVSNDKKAS